MVNLRPRTTNLPFVVWVSQRAGARHDVRVTVAPSAKVDPSLGPRLSANEEKLLADWVGKNRAVLVGFWNADIEYTEDLIEKIQPV